MPSRNERAARAMRGFGLAYPTRVRPPGAEATVPGSRHPLLLLRHGLGSPPRGGCQAKNCQLGTAYGGESNCIIKT